MKRKLKLKNRWKVLLLTILNVSVYKALYNSDGITDTLSEVLHIVGWFWLLIGQLPILIDIIDGIAYKYNLK